ncbi:MAG: AMP-binding protein, partial [bacterium]|nr:AMP-binding protein [bacterium]
LKMLHGKTGKTNAYEYLSLADVQAKTSLKDRLFDHIMIFENYPVAEELKQSTKKQGLPFDVDSIETREQSNYFFNIIIAPGKTIQISFAYDAGVCDSIYIEKLRHHFTEIITQVVNSPRVHLENIQIITEKEKRQILYEYNSTTGSPADKTLHQLFEEQVKKGPHRIAVIGPGTRPQTLTYRQLNETSNRLARIIRNKGVAPDHIVGIMVERSLEMVTGLLAILKAGGAYLPIAPETPGQRVRLMLKDCNTRLMLIHR